MRRNKSKEGVETIEIIDEWALIYMDKFVNRPQNAIDGKSTAENDSESEFKNKELHSLSQRDHIE
jgi:hypothetical protein